MSQVFSNNYSNQVFSNNYSNQMLIEWQCVGCSKVLATAVSINLDPMQLLDMGWPIVSVGWPGGEVNMTPVTIHSNAAHRDPIRAEYVCSCGPQSFAMAPAPTGKGGKRTPATQLPLPIEEDPNGHVKSVPMPIRDAAAQEPAVLCGDLLDNGGETYACRLPVGHYGDHQGFPIRQSNAPSLIEPPEELGWTNKSPNRRRP